MNDRRPNRVEITLTREKKAIVIDGHDVSGAVRSLVLCAEPRRQPWLELDVPIVDATRIDMDAVVELPHHVEDLLLRLGWTPPGMERASRPSTPTGEQPVSRERALELGEWAAKERTDG